ncbi:MAG TPA: S8 family peptidase [Alphaproteobacteria bacterium]|nr:S8 family peptidase [Alphaproteobacteria bacterium]
MPSRYNLPHIDLSGRAQSTPYTPAGSNPVGAGTPRIREEHGARLRSELATAYEAFDAQRRIDERLGEPEGVFLELELRPGTPIEAVERKRDGYTPGATRLGEEKQRVVGLFVPDASRDLFDAILEEYQAGALKESGSPPRKSFVEPIDVIRQARFETFWTDTPERLPEPGVEMWWEAWCVRGREDTFREMIEALGARTADAEQWLRFPEHIVVPVLATRALIELVLFTKLTIVELRRGSDTPTFFLDELDADEQNEVTEEFAERVQWPGADAPAVCLLDTGVNRGHMLIEPALANDDMAAVIEAWGVDDNEGHGTGMAGLALFGNLVPHLAGNDTISLRHRLESVKLLPPRGFPPTEERFYGARTKQAVALPELREHQRARVFCLAITNEDRSGVRPTTWSAAIDQEAAGVSVAGDNVARRLFVVSAGNAPTPIDYAQLKEPDALEIEDPAQAWNALTVGGCTDLVNIDELALTDYTPLAAAGDISPYTRTSTLWTQGKSPFKPDIVMEAGNRAVSPSKTDVYCVDSLALLSTGSQIAQHPLTPFRATSAATAQAARLAARLMAAFPDYWPETIRALIVHSAEWTPNMLAQLDNATGKQDRYLLLRRFGHGVPSFERAAASAQNHLALVSQATIQPYRRSPKGMNECHFYSLPWPREPLEALADQDVKLKITLSYFVEPNPGSSASFDPFRYQSLGLRFDLKRRNETPSNFAKRINKKVREVEADKPTATVDTDRWRFGANAMSAGSLHCDEWTGPAVNLLSRNLICIRPVGGWWNNRANAEIRSQEARYALVLSLRAADSEINLHTQISALVEQDVGIETISIPGR